MKPTGLVLFIVLVVLAIIFVPMGLIWALNTLFPMLEIPLTFSTWGAALFISSLLTAGRTK